jgi:hypothetical protein
MSSLLVQLNRGAWRTDERPSSRATSLVSPSLCRSAMQTDPSSMSSAIKVCYTYICPPIEEGVPLSPIWIKEFCFKILISWCWSALFLMLWLVSGSVGCVSGSVGCVSVSVCCVSGFGSVGCVSGSVDVKK